LAVKENGLIGIVGSLKVPAQNVTKKYFEIWQLQQE
jgi:hypothetical protein